MLVESRNLVGFAPTPTHFSFLLTCAEMCSRCSAKDSGKLIRLVGDVVEGTNASSHLDALAFGLDTRFFDDANGSFGLNLIFDNSRLLASRYIRGRYEIAISILEGTEFCSVLE